MNLYTDNYDELWYADDEQYQEPSPTNNFLGFPVNPISYKMNMISYFSQNMKYTLTAFPTHIQRQNHLTYACCMRKHKTTSHNKTLKSLKLSDNRS